MLKKSEINISLKREIITTADGSTTIHIPDWNEQYHSKHGAIQEAYHVFIKSGLDQISSKDISILEIGLGTGLNCFISYLEGKKRQLNINYTGVEAYPISENEFSKLNYVSELKSEEFDVFNKIHASNWEEKIELEQNFSFLKRKQLFQEINDCNCFNLIYFDAFGARVQPELWSVLIFKKMYDALKENGILVTYSAKGSVRRAMIEVGFSVKKIPGPPGKREMLRAIKLT